MVNSHIFEIWHFLVEKAYLLKGAEAKMKIKQLKTFKIVCPRTLNIIVELFQFLEEISNHLENKEETLYNNGRRGSS